MDTKALYNLTYGVYFMSAQENGKDNACIINTAVQVANNPTRISIAAIKGNLTHDMILATGKCNLSSLTTDAPFSLFQHFGMQSGRDVDKFADCEADYRTSNGIKYIPKFTNACFSLKVISKTDVGSHTLFVGDVTEAVVLGEGNSCTYAHYHKSIKPKN